MEYDQKKLIDAWEHACKVHHDCAINKCHDETLQHFLQRIQNMVGTLVKKLTVSNKNELHLLQLLNSKMQFQFYIVGNTQNGVRYVEINHIKKFIKEKNDPHTKNT